MEYRIVEMKDGGFDVEKCRLGTCWNKAIYIRFPTYEEAKKFLDNYMILVSDWLTNYKDSSQITKVHYEIHDEYY
jgi:hypothetical protein